MPLPHVQPHGLVRLRGDTKNSHPAMRLCRLRVRVYAPSLCHWILDNEYDGARGCVVQQELLFGNIYAALPGHSRILLLFRMTGCAHAFQMTDSRICMKGRSRLPNPALLVYVDVGHGWRGNCSGGRGVGSRMATCDRAAYCGHGKRQRKLGDSPHGADANRSPDFVSTLSAPFRSSRILGEIGSPSCGTFDYCEVRERSRGEEDQARGCCEKWSAWLLFLLSCGQLHSRMIQKRIAPAKRRVVR
jgi:hypothetical protein